MTASRYLSLVILVAGLSAWTLAPYGGCSCNNPLGPTSGPTLTPTPTHGPVVADFHDAVVGNDASNYVNHWQGASAPSADSLGASNLTQVFVSGGYNGLPALHLSGAYGNTSSAHGCIPGPPQIASTYPYVAFRMYLNPLAGAMAEDVDASVAPAFATGIRFWAKQGTSSNSITLKLILKPLADYAGANGCAPNAFGYHQASRPVPTTWTQISIPLSSFVIPSWVTGTIYGTNYQLPTANNLGAGATAIRDSSGHLHLMAAQFEPTNPTSYPAVQSFDFYIDQLEFY